MDDRPWSIERLVPLSEIRLPKHRFPEGCERYFPPGGIVTTLITGFNDQFADLFKYSRVRCSSLLLMMMMIKMMKF